MNPNQEQFLSWLRSTMSGVGYLLTAYGVSGADAWWPTVSGIMLAVVPYVWGYFAHTDSAKLAAVEAIPAVNKIVVSSGAPRDVKAVVADADRPKVVSQ
jgi:hypothetical protein